MAHRNRINTYRKKSGLKMDMEEVYLRQITELLKKQNELQDANNNLLKELLQRLGEQK